MNTIKGLTSFDPKELDNYNIGYYDKSIYVDEDDVLYHVGNSANYHRVRFKKTISAYGNNIPPRYEQVVKIQRTGKSQIDQRDHYELKFERYSDDTGRYYTMPQDFIDNNLIINEDYADFFRTDPNGDNPYNGTEWKVYDWFMCYDKNDPQSERFCFLQHNIPRWPDLFSLHEEFLKKLEALKSVPDIKSFTLLFDELNFGIVVNPLSLSNHYPNLSIPSSIYFYSFNNDPTPDKTAVLSTMKRQKGSPALSAINNADSIFRVYKNGEVDYYSAASDAVNNEGYFKIFNSKEMFHKMPQDLNNNNGLDIYELHETSAHFYFFGETEKIYLLNDEKQLFFDITLYSLPRGPNWFGLYEYVFLIDHFKEIIHPENSYCIKSDV
jgi:hypothetical protein